MLTLFFNSETYEYTFLKHFCVCVLLFPDHVVNFKVPLYAFPKLKIEFIV